MDRCEGKLICFKCPKGDSEGFTCETDHKCTSCGKSHMASFKECYFVHLRERKKSQAIKSGMKHVNSSLFEKFIKVKTT